MLTASSSLYQCADKKVVHPALLSSISAVSGLDFRSLFVLFPAIVLSPQLGRAED